MYFQNRNPTIKTTKQGACTLGQRDGFSTTDLMKINKLYGCSATSGGGTVAPNPTTTVKPTAGKCDDTHM